MRIPCGIFAVLSLTACSLAAEVVVINDQALEKALLRGISAFAEDGKGPSAATLATAVKHAPKTLEVEIEPAAVGENPERSVYMFGSVYKCGSCDDWHLGGIASAWALTADGLMVTNYHVFEDEEGDAMGVGDMDGNVHRIVEIVAADRKNDIAVFRVDAKGLTPLPIGPAAKVGDRVSVISHPDSYYYTHTFGHVSRYHRTMGPGKTGPTVEMSITADYALGSSGAPVLDSEGRAIGMVSSTTSVYYDAETEDTLQMVVKNCVPGSAIAALVQGGNKPVVPAEPEPAAAGSSTDTPSVSTAQ